MTREQFIEKWSTYLSGKFSRFAFCETTGPGLEARVRVMVNEIETTVAKMYSDARDEAKPVVPVNGQPQIGEQKSKAVQRPSA